MYVWSYDEVWYVWVCTYVMRQYELCDSYKVRMVSLPRGLCRVRVKGFHSFVSLWHELSKSAPPKALLSGGVGARKSMESMGKDISNRHWCAWKV